MPEWGTEAVKAVHRDLHWKHGRRVVAHSFLMTKGQRADGKPSARCPFNGTPASFRINPLHRGFTPARGDDTLVLVS